jgi:hypothetical protein
VNLREGLAWLDRGLIAHDPCRVEYRRAGRAPITFDASKGKPRFEVTDETGVSIRAHLWDFLALAVDLGFEPKAGDVIIADGRRYEVMDLGPDGCWQWTGSHMTTYRIHTKDTGESNA